MHDDRMCDGWPLTYYAGILFGLLLVIALGVHMYWQMSSYDYVPCVTQPPNVSPIQIFLSFTWTTTFIAAVMKNSVKLAIISAVFTALFILSFAMQPTFACMP